MDLPPSDFYQIFTLEFYCDLIFYGFLMGGVACVPFQICHIKNLAEWIRLVNFVIVLWGYFPGDLGVLCNEEDSDVCSPVFLARGTCFATLVIIL